MGWDGWGRGGRVKGTASLPAPDPVVSDKPFEEVVAEDSFIDRVQFPKLSVTIITDDQTSMRGIRVSDLHGLIKTRMVMGKLFWLIDDPECPQYKTLINPDHILAIRTNKTED